MATMATLFAGGRILTRRSSMGARATFRSFNDAKSAQLEVRVDAHGRLLSLSADAIFSARTGVHARGARARSRWLSRGARHRIRATHQTDTITSTRDDISHVHHSARVPFAPAPARASTCSRPRR
jgi:hypothetical protein